MKRWLRNDFFKDLIKGSVTLLTGSMGGALLGLAILSLTLKGIGAEWYGIYIVVLTYTEIFDQLFNFQSWLALVKLGANELESGRREHFCQYLKIAFYFDVSTSSVGAVFALVFAGLIGNYLAWEPFQILLARLYALWIVTHVVGMPIGTLRLLGEYSYIARHRIISSAFRLCLILIAFLFHADEIIFIYCLLCSEIVDNLLLYFIALYRLRRHGFGGWHKAKIDWKQFWNFFRFGIWTNIETTLNLPVSKFDKIIISKMFSYEIVSVYKFFDKFAQIIRKILSSLIYVLFPEFSKSNARNQMSEVYRNSVRLGIMVLLFGIPLWIVFSFTSFFWVGPLFSETFVKYIPHLILFIGFRTLSAAFVSLEPILISQGFLKFRFTVNVSSSIVFYACLFAFGFKMGLLGFILSGIIMETYKITVKLIVLTARKNKTKPAAD